MLTRISVPQRRAILKDGFWGFFWVNSYINLLYLFVYFWWLGNIEMLDFSWVVLENLVVKENGCDINNDLCFFSLPYSFVKVFTCVSV